MRGSIAQCTGSYFTVVEILKSLTMLSYHIKYLSNYTEFNVGSQGVDLGSPVVFFPFHSQFLKLTYGEHLGSSSSSRQTSLSDGKQPIYVNPVLERKPPLIWKLEVKWPLQCCSYCFSMDLFQFALTATLSFHSFPSVLHFC